MTRAALPILGVARPTLRTAPITKASGRSMVVLARVARNRRLADACERWAFCSLTPSPGGRRYHDALRAHGKTQSQATRQLANRRVGQSLRLLGAT